MFQAMEAFRGQLKAAHITLSFVGGNRMSVSVTPVVTDEEGKKNPELAQPFAFTATAAELDAGFVKALSHTAGTRKSLVEQAEANAAALKSAAAKATTSKSSAGTKPAPSNSKVPVSLDEEEEERDADSNGVIESGPSNAASTSAAPVAAVAAPATSSNSVSSVADLFNLGD